MAPISKADKPKKQKKCSQCKTLASEKKTAEDKVEQLEAQVLKLTNSKTNLKSKYKDFKAKNSTLESNVGTLKDKVQELQDENVYLINHGKEAKAAISAILAKWPSGEPGDKCVADTLENNIPSPQNIIPPTPSTSKSCISTPRSHPSTSTTRVLSAEDLEMRSVSIFFSKTTFLFLNQSISKEKKYFLIFLFVSHPKIFKKYKLF